MDGIIDGIAFGLLIVAQFLAVIVVANSQRSSGETKKSFTWLRGNRSRTMG